MMERSREECDHTPGEPCWGFCHASCCGGFTHLRNRHHFLQHHAQQTLDSHGFNVGYFGDKHHDVLRLLVELMTRHGATFFGVQNILEEANRRERPQQ